MSMTTTIAITQSLCNSRLGQKGTHSFIQCQKQSDGEVSLVSEHPDFTVEHHSPVSVDSLRHGPL